MIYQIWVEGYLATGMEGIPEKAQQVGAVEADNFQDACDKLCSPQELQDKWGYYSSDRKTLWGCKLFDNEQDARKSFG